MNLIKKFKDYAIDKFIKTSPHYFNGVYAIDVQEVQNICQGLIDDFGFNRQTGKPTFGVNAKSSETVSQLINAIQMPDIIDRYTQDNNKFPLPVFKDGILFSLQFSRPKSEDRLTPEFYDTIEEIIDRMESTFPIELYDENARTNRIVRGTDGGLYWKFNPEGMEYGGLKKLDSILYCDYFSLAFKLNDTQDKNIRYR